MMLNIFLTELNPVDFSRRYVAVPASMVESIEHSWAQLSIRGAYQGKVLPVNQIHLFWFHYSVFMSNLPRGDEGRLLDGGHSPRGTAVIVFRKGPPLEVQPYFLLYFITEIIVSFLTDILYRNSLTKTADTSTVANYM